MPTATQIIAWVALVLASVLAAYAILSASSPVAPPQQKPAIAQTQAEASSRTPLGMAVTWALRIKAMQRRPESIVWDQVLASKDGTVICLDYRIRSDLGDRKEQVAFVSKSGALTMAPWQAACLGDVSPVIDAQKWIPRSTTELRTRM